MDSSAESARCDYENDGEEFNVREARAEDIDAAIKRISDRAYEIALSHIKGTTVNEATPTKDKITRMPFEGNNDPRRQFRAILSELNFGNPIGEQSSSIHTSSVAVA
ncbi:hypothetical protein HPP92_025397 [Vanilla planifolia]|uniref:Uncharacterized protein n=1 Tax=Vanilla planifolia TaxID=51239 RepID=A0A835PJX6_VANPL|nr:hypothetical protein HPP92_025397 [Vanilla planifolia]